mgnify:CR=1 FL=1
MIIDLENYAGRLGPFVSQSVDDALLLASEASKVPAGGVIFEFAGQRGFSMAALSSGCAPGVIMWTSEKDLQCLQFLYEQEEMHDVNIIAGDLTQKQNLLPKQINLLHCDAYHDAGIARWYIDQLWSRVVPGGTICVHDMSEKLTYMQDERTVVLDALEQRGWEYHCPTEHLPLRKWNTESYTNNCQMVIRVPLDLTEETA